MAEVTGRHDETEKFVKSSINLVSIYKLIKDEVINKLLRSSQIGVYHKLLNIIKKINS